MKIGFCGAGATGKSSTLMKIKPHLPNLPLLPSPARAVFARWGISEVDQENMSVDDKVKLQNEIYEARFQQEIAIPEFISDRTLLDNYAYHLFRCYQGITDVDLNIHSQRTLENLQTYDHLFYFPLLNTVEFDGFRYSNLAYQTMIDSIIYAFLEKNNIKYEKVPVMPVAERVTYICNIVGDCT